MSKYHGVLLLPCLLGYLLASGRWRYLLKTVRPYLAVLAGAAVFFPNILWNWRHGWISYRFQLGHGVGGGWRFSINKLSAAIGGQLGAASPVIFGIFIAAAVFLIRRRPRQESDRFLIWTSLPVFVFFLLAGAGGKLLPHWTFPGWWAGALVTGVYLASPVSDPRAERRRRLWYRAGAVLAVVMIAGMYLGMAFPLVRPLYGIARGVSLRLHEFSPALRPLKPFDHTMDLTNDLYGWPEAARFVEAVRAGMPRPERTFVFAHRPFTASQLAAELPASTVVTTINRRPDQYLLWFDPAHVFRIYRFYGFIGAARPPE